MTMLTSQRAYGNMVHFHAHCLSGGFILSLLIAVVGSLIFYFKLSLMPALVFAAYHVLISTYLNLLGGHLSYCRHAELTYSSGTMATMHQPESPLTSGRLVLWRTIPLLFLSPTV